MIKLGIVMDPITGINIEKDTSFAMLLAAQRRGYLIYYMELGDLYLQDGEAFSTCCLLTVRKNKQRWFELGKKIVLALSELDVILMRKDPPVNVEYIYATHILELAEAKGVLIVNKPQSLRDCNEKLFTIIFNNFMPPTLVTTQTKLLQQFHRKYSDIILKPLDGMGGASIFRIRKNDSNLSVIIETLTKHNSVYCMAQRYIPEIKQGDKRVLIVAGQVVPYCLARIPKLGETRGNLAAGGRGVVQNITKNDKYIAETIAPFLIKKGLLFVGLDIIGNKLTEINVTSPTGLCQIESAQPKFSITNMLFDAIEQLIKHKNIDNRLRL